MIIPAQEKTCDWVAKILANASCSVRERPFSRCVNFCHHFDGVSGFVGSAGFGACSLASASSTRFLKSP
jgi:hypothetical protein